MGTVTISLNRNLPTHKLSLQFHNFNETLFYSFTTFFFHHHSVHQPPLWVNVKWEEDQHRWYHLNNLNKNNKFIINRYISRSKSRHHHLVRLTWTAVVADDDGCHWKWNENNGKRYIVESLADCTTVKSSKLAFNPIFLWTFKNNENCPQWFGFVMRSSITKGL